MDILFFNPYYSQPKKYYSFFTPAAPLNLMYLAAYLKKFGFESDIHELGIFEIKEAILQDRRIRFGFSDEAIRDIILANKPKIVGITCMYSVYYRDVLEIARTVKRIDSEIQIVIGGNHASTYWNYILKNDAIDFVVIGEGEETILELARRLLRKQAVGDVDGLAYRTPDGEIVRTKERELIKDLDNIPYPAVEKIDYRRYFSQTNPFAMRSPVIAVISSRGCPGQCVYCTVKAVWGRTWRGRSPKNVVDEIEFLMKKYGVREFAFLDDSASVNRQRWEGICDEMIARKLDIRWTTPNGIAHWTLTKDIIKKMKQAGCYRVTFGIESGNPETRKFLGKPYSLAQARELIQYANRIGMWTICTNIIGFPYENKDSIRDTIEFAKKSGTDFACFYLLIPQPTSDVYEYFRKEGLLDFDNFFESDVFDEEKFEQINYVLNETGSDTLYFKKEELSRLQKEAYRDFLWYRAHSYLLNPLKFFRKIHNSEDLMYILRMLNKGIKIFSRTLNPLNKKSSDYFYEKTKESVDV